MSSDEQTSGLFGLEVTVRLVNSSTSHTFGAHDGREMSAERRGFSDIIDFSNSTYFSEG